MITKLDLYKVFCQVGKSKSFSKASKELYMTQPAVSQAIMQLEGELDVRLFNRTPRGVSLTNEGSILFEYVNSAINLINAGEEKILEFKDLTVGELKIGVGDTISKYFLLPYLEFFHNRYPNIKFKIINGTTLELCSLIKSGEINIAICNFPIDDKSLESRPCREIRDIFVCGEKYKDLSREKISLEEMVKYPLIFLEPNSNSRKYVEKFMLSKGIKISPEFELGSFDLLLEFAKINLGIACVIKEFSRDYLEKGLLYEVNVLEEIPSRSIGVCYLKDVPLSLACAKFVEILSSANYSLNDSI
ncbi:LysR family transcriptional regulator [Terrisporobacter sp.]|uniref:LysR family transcriptional regulator n=1 Tax=Terrisporobacter sp. TaxID=1965305 RepID=UPI00262AAECC|nr:LysR family transcriptional regulator [Terrisporobacter sp.]